MTARELDILADDLTRPAWLVTFSAARVSTGLKETWTRLPAVDVIMIEIVRMALDGHQKLNQPDGRPTF